MQRAGATLHCGAWASHCSGFSCCGAQALDVRASIVVVHGLKSADLVVVACRLGCSAARGIFPDQGLICVPCIGRRILNHCATREVPTLISLFFFPRVNLLISLLTLHHYWSIIVLQCCVSLCCITQ